MMKGGHMGKTNQLHDINWGTLSHASCASQLCHVTTIYKSMEMTLCQSRVLQASPKFHVQNINFTLHTHS